MYLVFTKKFFDNYWKLIGWIAYISLVAISVWFTMGVLDKYARQETAIQQDKDKIESHPTIAICRAVGFDTLEYQIQKHINITYTTYQSNGLSVEDEVVLKMGENDLENSKDNVNLTLIHTLYSGPCLTISTNRKVDETDTEIKIMDLEINLSAFLTSDKNSYGVTRMDWRDGEVYKFEISRGIRKDLTLTVDKNINLKCSEESFYQYVASNLSEKSFELCNNTCLMISLPNNPYPICPNWMERIKHYITDCNWNITRNLIQNITDNNEHQKTCITTQYYALSKEGKSTSGEAIIRYRFSLPLKTKVYEEYFIIDSIGLIGSVGGTLGVFIGFSFSNLIICTIEYIQSLMKKKLGKHQISRNFVKENFLKCLEWMIYLSLMTAAILFAREVIEKFFGQNTGIKQNMEKLESHPTITICPFMYQCDRPMKLNLRLKGYVKLLAGEYEGSYNIYSSDLINGKQYWIHKYNRSLALMYNSQLQLWIFGPKVLNGSDGAISGNSYGLEPYEISTWQWNSNGIWIPIRSTDVVLEKG